MLVKQDQRHFICNLLAVSNLLLIGYSFFVMRQLLALYQLGERMGLPASAAYKNFDIVTIRLFLTVLLPFFFLLPKFRKQVWISWVMLFLLFWNNPLHTWNLSGVFTKVPVYLSLFFSGYALLWLLNQLPYQSRPQ